MIPHVLGNPRGLPRALAENRDQNQPVVCPSDFRSESRIEFRDSLGPLPSFHSH